MASPKPAPKKTVTQVKSSLDELARLRAEQSAVESDRDARLNPLRQAFDSAAATVTAEFNPRLADLGKRIAELEKGVVAAMTAEITSDSIPKPIESSGLVAEVTRKQGREIRPQAFLAAVPETERTPEFWKCLRILLERAEVFLGKEAVKGIAVETFANKVQIRPA